MKCSCSTPKLKAYNPVNLDHIFYFVDGKWVVSDPQINNFFHATKYRFEVTCLNCHKHWQEEELYPQYSASVHHKEVVLDLDQTLFSVEYAWEEPTADFTMNFEKHPLTYYVFKRPGLDKFMKELEKRFDKINFFTAAKPWYASKLIESLHVVADKMGYVKTSEDTHRSRPLSFEWEMMKPMNDCFVIDDKHLVIDGFNNTVLKINPYHYRNTNDNVLDQVLSFLNKEQKELKIPSHISGDIVIHLRSLDIKIYNLPWEKYKDILSVDPSTQEDINKLPIRTSAHKNYFEFENNIAQFSITDMTYEGYSKLYSVIKDYTKHQLLSEEAYDDLVKKRAMHFDDNF